jgi:hypothetical protein
MAVVLIFLVVAMATAVVPVTVEINMSWTASRTGCQARRCDVQA